MKRRWSHYRFVRILRRKEGNHGTHRKWAPNIYVTSELPHEVGVCAWGPAWAIKNRSQKSIRFVSSLLRLQFPRRRVVPSPVERVKAGEVLTP